MKLKGKNSERLNEQKKAVMQKTLDKMSDNRKKDDSLLRDTVKNKILWITEEKQKGIGLITEHRKRIEDLNIQLYRLEGALSILNDIIKPEIKEEAKK